VTSTVHLARRVLKDMVARKQGRILITSSIAGQAPSPLEAVHGASKAFLTSFSDAPRPVRLCWLAPASMRFD
jgi:short-subunit dehydrogenase